MKKWSIGFVFVLGVLTMALGFQQKPETLPANEVELGKQLFFDNILSKDYKISCASCHNPKFAFADSVPFSHGNDGSEGKRNAPSVMNMASRSIFFFDGRAATLEAQAIFPIEDPLEMDLPIEQAITRLKENAFYAAAFKKIYKKSPNKELLGKALAAYESTLETSASDWDLFAKGKESNFSEAAQRGREIFNEKGKCFDCHFGPDFTGDEFRNIGLFNNKDLNDAGRFWITKNSSDIGKFKVPGLRNVAVTAPYMHNGMFKTLREVVDYYNEPEKFVQGSLNTDSLLSKPLGLNEQEITDLIAFLESLTDQQFKK